MLLARVSLTFSHSLDTRHYHPLLMAGPLDNIRYPYIAVIGRF